MWYVLHLFVDLDKFLTRYRTLPRKVQSMVQDMVTLRQPSKALYQRDLSMFVGYVFIQTDPKSIKLLNDALRTEGLAEVLTAPGSRFILPMKTEEVSWVHSLLKSRSDSPLTPGTKVRIVHGPYEGMEGIVDSVAGSLVAVRVKLRRSVSLAYCPEDEVESLQGAA